MVPRLAGSLALIALGIAGCRGDRVVRSHVSFAAADGIKNADTLLKVHLTNGSVALMSGWTVDTPRRLLHGMTALYDINRTIIHNRPDTFAFDSISIIESNRIDPSSALYGMTLLTTASLALSTACAFNPKACFGSCPTFYASDGTRRTLQAEGFSSSIAPALEATDLDALYNVRPEGRRMTITMTNEALETHVVRYVDLMAARRPPGGRVLATSEGRMFQVHDIRKVSRADGPEGPCLDPLRSFDNLERFSVADSTDLAARETVELRFDSVGKGARGLVIGFRESLMTTYLFYQGLAYLGTNAGAWLAQCQRDPAGVGATLERMRRTLGGIEVLALDRNGEWIRAGEVDEAGPIATNLQLLPLPSDLPSPLRIRLRMAKGLWRLNWLALASVGDEVAPLRLHPVEVLRRDTLDSKLLERPSDSTRSLTTSPGDIYDFIYELPEDYAGYELFLESRGYYIEWMREEWLAEENAARVVQMFMTPASFLRDEAPRFKAIEPQLEHQFWNSRYVKQ